MIRRSYDIHGVRVNVRSSAAELLEHVEGILGSFATDTLFERADLAFSLRRAQGKLDLPRSWDLRQVWRGAMPGGQQARYWSGPDKRHLELIGQAAASVDLAARTADIAVLEGREAALTFGIFTPALCLLMHQAGRHVIHAACLGKGGKALLLAGGGGQGKTTAALALAHQGLALHGDDACFAGNFGNGLEVFGLPRPCKVHARTIELCPWLSTLPLQAIGGDEFALPVRAVSASAKPRLLSPAALVVLGPRTQGKHVLAPLDKVAAVAELARQNVQALDKRADGPAGRTFDTIAQLVAASTTWTLRVGTDLATLGKAIGPLLEQGQ